MRTLHLALKERYFQQIREGEKDLEYRLVNDHWWKRLESRQYDQIHFSHGYPKADDPLKHLWVPWCGCFRTTICHPHFGGDPVEVYAIYIHLEL
jgi:hypothetical protein